MKQEARMSFLVFHSHQLRWIGLMHHSKDVLLIHLLALQQDYQLIVLNNFLAGMVFALSVEGRFGKWEASSQP
jgi:hypothetical protein